MQVKPTKKWINSIAVPDCGIIRKPLNLEAVNVSNTVGKWLVAAGFALTEDTQVEMEIQSGDDSETEKFPAGEDSVIESPKSKKAKQQTTATNSESNQ